MFEYKYDISIVMGYYNRKPQLINTLNYFKDNYLSYNFEVIIVDDNSTIEHRLDDIVNNYTFPLKYIKITEKEKGNRINPCVPYNKGFREAKGRRIIIQNPECIHVGNILQYVIDKLSYDDYIAFSCYNCSSKELTEMLLKNLSLINNRQFNSVNRFPWYNHPIYRPMHYHFCAAIMNDNLKLLGGFNEEFAKGHSYDDNEILLSIKYNLKLNIKTIPPHNNYVIHQWHARDAESKFSRKDFSLMLNKNKLLYESYVEIHRKNNFNFPKLLHLYWDGSNFSFLNLLTVLSFNKYNIGWKINIFKPLRQNMNISWKTNEQKDKYTGKDYFHLLEKLNNVNIHIIDTDLLPFKFKDASEVIKSDFFRLFILNKYGGLWSDFDIIYTNSIERYYAKKNLQDKQTILYRYKWSEANKNVYPVGLFLSGKNSSIFSSILKNIHLFYNKNNYQCLGTTMFETLFERYKTNNILKKIIMNMKLKELYIDNSECYLKIKWDQLDILYDNEKENVEEYLNNDNIFGIHWFNGAKKSKQYCNNLKLEELKNTNSKNLMDKFVKQYIDYIQTI